MEVVVIPYYSMVLTIDIKVLYEGYMTALFSSIIRNRQRLRKHFEARCVTFYTVPYVSQVTGYYASMCVLSESDKV